MLKISDFLVMIIGRLSEWGKRYKYGCCTHCFSEKLCKRYYFTDGKTNWDKLICKSCFKEMIFDLKDLQSKILKACSRAEID